MGVTLKTYEKDLLDLSTLHGVRAYPGVRDFLIFLLLRRAVGREATKEEIMCAALDIELPNVYLKELNKILGKWTIYAITYEELAARIFPESYQDVAGMLHLMGIPGPAEVLQAGLVLFEISGSERGTGGGVMFTTVRAVRSTVPEITEGLKVALRERMRCV